MPALARIILAVLLLLVVAACVYQGIAAREVPESRWTYWLIDGIIGFASLTGACWLVWPRRSSVQGTNP